MTDAFTSEVEQQSLRTMETALIGTQAATQLAFSAMQSASIMVSRVMVDTTIAVCKQIEKCETIDELTAVISKLREATRT